MVMLTPTEKRVTQRQQKIRRNQRERTTKPNRRRHKCPMHRKYVQVPEKELTPAVQSRRHQFKREEGELPEVNRQVEKENGKSRSSRGDAVCSGRTPEVRNGREKRKCGRSVSATSVGGTTSGAMAKWNNQRKYQQTQKRFRHKCRAYKYRKNNGAKGKKEIKLIKGMGRGWRAAIEVKCRSDI